jgi:Lrp/AsnC family transcriptional regulator, leucine-responsive regulatory protein
MDLIDKKILSLLQANAKMPNSEIARQVGMVPSGVLERIRKLEDNGYIKEYTASLKPESLNLGLLAFVFLRTSEMPGCQDTAKILAEFPEILEVHHVAGEDCYLLKIRLKDNQTLATYLREKIGHVPNVVSTKTVIVLETVKETSKINLPLDESDI